MSKIVKAEFIKLKRLKDLTIEFPERGVVALMGENGIGKSTVLHALACVYRPHEHLQVKKFDEGSWWTDWFVPHTGNYWDGSSIFSLSLETSFTILSFSIRIFAFSPSKKTTLSL